MQRMALMLKILICIWQEGEFPKIVGKNIYEEDSDIFFQIFKSVSDSFIFLILGIFHSLNIHVLEKYIRATLPIEAIWIFAIDEEGPDVT